jgi:hypothetical protein
LKKGEKSRKVYDPN